jgi:hypothetical protein
MKNKYLKIGIVTVAVLVLLILAFNINDVINGFKDAMAGK